MKRLATTAIAAALAVTACGSSDDASSNAGATNAKDCAADATLKKGSLTIATGDPAYPPYVIDDKPESGQGFEAAVGVAVAKEMGFEGAAVTWTGTQFEASVAPGPKDFDLNLQQFTITEDRKKNVDFSEGYYTAAQAVFGLADSPAASAKSVSDLKDLKIGVASGTTSVDYVENVIKPSSDPLIFNDNAAAKLALESKQIDAVVSDLPTALYITGVEIEGTKVFGQIEGSGTDQFGFVLGKGSALTKCVDLALESLKKSGELEKITTKWMSEYTEAPTISAS